MLETLDISGNNIGCAAAVRIAAGLAVNSHLRRLDACSNPITASGASALLAPLLSSPALELVNVMHCTLSDGASDRHPATPPGAGAGAGAGTTSPQTAPGSRWPGQRPGTTHASVPLFTVAASAAVANSGSMEAGPRAVEVAARSRVGVGVVPNFVRRVPAAPAAAAVLSAARFAALWERLDLAAASRGWVLQYAAAAARALWLQPEQCATMAAGLLQHHEGSHADAVATAVRSHK